MARYDGAEPILEAAERWRDECLLRDGSLFSDRQLWTPANFEELDRHYVQNLDYGEGDFFSKLEAQLEAAAPEAKQLAAEMFWALYLIVHESFISAKTKRYQIRKVWEWSGEPLPEDHWALGEVLAQGVANPGTAYNTHRWRELRFFVTAMKDWKVFDRDRRKEFLDDPWQFARWLEKREYAAGRQFRHVLLFLLFPEHFERMATASHKRKVVRNFREQWNEDPEEFDYDDRVALDREVLRIRERLEEKYGNEEVDFYEPPVVSEWRPDADDDSDGDGPALVPEEEARRWYRDQFGDARTWLMSTGEGRRMWSEFLDGDIVAIGWDFLGDLTEYPDKEAISQAITDHTDRENPVNDALACWQFSHEMEEGDLVIAKHGRSRLLGLARVEGGYFHDLERGEYQKTRPVEWKRTGLWEIPDGLQTTNKTLTDITDSPAWIHWAVQRMEGGDGGERPPEADGEYTMEDALDGLFIAPHEFTRILDTLSRRKNIILQGPPGVGKTFIARRIAWRFIGRKDPSRFEMVQFHQSYAYEDFVQGWRPTEEGGFELQDGVFHRFCRRAREASDPHVLVIDEINRGDLSRIFGELMMLIEEDKRGGEHAVPLTYARSGEEFYVPENVFVIGLMNTADRSLAMVDYALRRRFGFVDLEPAFGNERFSEYLLEQGVDEEVVETIDRRLSELNEGIAADTKNLGPGYRIGHSYFVPSGDEESLDEGWYREIVETQIAPLLREYWFDQSEKADRHVERLLA